MPYVSLVGCVILLRYFHWETYFYACICLCLWPRFTLCPVTSIWRHPRLSFILQIKHSNEHHSFRFHSVIETNVHRDSGKMLWRLTILVWYIAYCGHMEYIRRRTTQAYLHLHIYYILCKILKLVLKTWEPE